MSVTLRNVTDDDLPILFEHQFDPAATQMAAFAPRDEDAFMTHWRTNILGDPTVVKKTILFDGHVAGNIVSFGESDEREIGYWIGKEYWGQGIATDALSRFLEHETQRPLYAVVAAHNVGSIRVLEKCGFVVVGQGTGSAGGRGLAVEELRMKLRPDD